MNTQNLNPLLLCLSGSRAYGLNTPESDYDFRGVFSLSTLAEYSRFSYPEQLQGENSTTGIPERLLENVSKDTTMYNLDKFLRLASKSNPNILELLWTPPKHIRYSTRRAEKLISMRQKFLTNKIKYTFTGYAHGQLKRMKTHRKWLLDPPDLSKEINPPENLFSEANFDKTNLTEVSSLSSEYVAKIQKCREWYREVKNRKAYSSWLKNRNPTRAAKEAKCGYDTKNATHLMRLLFQAEGIISESRVIVDISELPGSQKEFLFRVRDGQITYEELTSIADKCFKSIKSTKINLPNPMGDDELYEVFCDIMEA